MSDQNRPKISDPTRVRALAHPLRLELIEVLGNLGEGTATQCAEQTGESVASCSFHLRMLAKYGYIEPADRRGKEKPWRLVEHSQSFTRDWDDPSSIHAVGELAIVTIEREAEHLRSWVRREADEPREWAEATTMSSSTIWLTREELDEVSTGLKELASRFADGREDPSARPVGARLVRLFAATSLDPQPRDAS